MMSATIAKLFQGLEQASHRLKQHTPTIINRNKQQGDATKATYWRLSRARTLKPYTNPKTIKLALARADQTAFARGADTACSQAVQATTRPRPTDSSPGPNPQGQPSPRLRSKLCLGCRSRHRTLSGAPLLPLDSLERPPSDPDDAPEPAFESSGAERAAPPEELLLPRFPPADRGREESALRWGAEVVVLLRAMFPRKLPSAQLKPTDSYF